MKPSGFLSVLGLLVLALLTADAASPTSATVTLGWDYVQGADPAVQVTVYRALDCMTYTPLAVLAIETRQFTDAAVPLGSLTCWELAAEDAAGVESLGNPTVAVLCTRQGQRVRCTPH
jgi:hypothetical protein